MIALVLSDTHGIDEKIIRAIVKEGVEKRNIELIIHCGDIKPRHANSELFNGFPVFCALTEDQVENPAFQNPPPGWTYTMPGERIINVNGIKMYLGHKRAFDFLRGSERSLQMFMDELRKDNDELRLVLCGHTHHQIFVQTPLVNFVNPGAVETGFNGHEFAVIDTDTNQIVFSRQEKTKPIIPTFSVGVISDSSRISKLDTKFWEKFDKEMLERDVGIIIHCGNIAVEDIGRPELEKFTIYCNLRQDQLGKIKSVPPNWQIIPTEEPIVEINGYRFFVRHDLGISLIRRSEIDMGDLCLKLRRQFNELDFVLCGFTRNALLVEQEQTCIVNPGDVVRDRDFAVICLPRCEITFGHVPLDPIF